jgi:hypothetical protein
MIQAMWLPKSSMKPRWMGQNRTARPNLPARSTHNARQEIAGRPMLGRRFASGDEVEQPGPILASNGLSVFAPEAKEDNAESAKTSFAAAGTTR